MFNFIFIVIMEKLKKIIYKALPYCWGACGVIFVLVVLWCIGSLIFGY